MESTQDLDISTDPETSGFDLSAGKTWIYPENYPLRDYQFTIVQAALYHNTLVCLPTGLGKTFIAAVIMYNFWRWYPRGKVIFLAPTRPLVAQQIDACHNIMGIPSIESIELTGSTNIKARQIAWFKKRVIFATPQVFHNDLENNIIPSELVKCVVIDEAHKALGKHSYCECIRIMNEKNPYFRILALSATPGNKIDNVHQVVQNLHISHIELRDETSPDIIPYTNKRKIDIILVPLGQELERYKERYISIMDRHVKRLIQWNVINGQTANISKGKIFIILREFQKKTDKSRNYGQIIKILNILLTMYHAYELMVRHGLRAFHKFYQNHSDKFWMNSECQLQELITDVETYLGPFPNIQELRNDDDIQNIPDNLIFGHNKFLKLKELLLQHFKQADATGNNTRAIVFVEYRDIVSEVYILLLQARPLIRPQMFVGQAEQKQKYQVKAIEDFRNNSVNVLISTSIGEEGLDVGEVDLIICFDVSQKSPTRLVQRMGRTGRKRDGHIIVLVTDGREHETLRSTMAKRQSLNSKILNTSNILSSLYENNPRMIPDKCTPQCHKMHINIQPKTPITKGKNSKKGDNTKVNETSARKNKNNKKVPSKEIKGIAQPSMAKFLVNTKNYEQFDNDELVQPTIIATTDEHNINNSMKLSNVKSVTCDNINNVIKPSNVKLLSCDNNAIDFLTLCAMKKSEKEMTPQVSKMDLTYISAPKLITNFFDFTVPSIDILDNLENYLSDIKNNEPVSEEDSQMDYDNNDDFWCNNQYDIVSPVNRNIDECVNVTESRFEDLLDESTDSDETMFGGDENNLNNEDKIITKHDTIGSTMKIQSNKKLDNDTSLNTNNNLAADAETSIFDDIFNDSFDSIENDSNIDNIKNNELKKVDSINNSLGTITNKELVKKEDNIMLDKMLSKKEHSKNETMFTITQAVHEIAQINSNVDVRPTITKKIDMVQPTTETSKSNSATSILHFRNDQEIIDYESEEDMFASLLDEDFEIDTASNELLEVENLKSDTLPDEKLNIFAKPEHKSNTQINTSNDFKGNTDFEVSSALITNSNYFKNSTDANIKDKSTVVSSFADDIMWDDSDSDEWISVDRCPESQKKDSMKIAKKLSTKKHSFSNPISRTVSVNHIMEHQNNSDNEFVIDANDMEKLNELETSYLSEGKSFVTRDYNASVATSSNYKNISLGRKETQASALKDLSSFKAPNKYLKEQKSDKITNTKSILPKYTQNLRDHSNANNRLINKKNKQKVQCEYIDNEAEVVFDDTLDESSGTDEDLHDFVSYTQHVQDEVDMHAVYLQNIKSQVNRPGAFIFKEPQVLKEEEEEDVYSQPCSQVDQSYLQDSFCVGSDHDEFEESVHGHGYSILEDAERVLEERKRKRIETDRSKSDAERKKKRRKKIQLLNTSTSSEDETEKLRNEICNKSMVL